MTASREPYRSVEQIAAWLGIRPATVREWARTGVITGHQPGGRVWLFRESEVEADIARSGRQPSELPVAPKPRPRPVAVSSPPITSIRDRIRRGELGSAPSPDAARAGHAGRGGLG